jgi:glucosamine-6-phosphate deaminase
MTEEFKVDNLSVKVYPDRLAMGSAAAAITGNQISRLLGSQEYINIIFAAAPSQNEFLAALIRREEIDWQRINAFHMDEYIGLPKGHPALFSSFLAKGLFERVPFHSVNYIHGAGADARQECKRYSTLLGRYPADIVCMGIGENGHIAFNDPHVANFADPKKVKVVALDTDCRQQQVNDGCFVSLDDVPTHAITLTIPALMEVKYIYCIVPGKNKAAATDKALNDEISERCPASVLRRHPGAILFLDADSFADNH